MKIVLIHLCKYIFNMKAIIVSVMLISCFLVSQAQDVKQDTTKSKKTEKPNKKVKSPAILFEETTHDFGTIPYNGDGTFEFKFTNTGKAPLILTNCQSSCGCTIPEWPKDPIPPKGKGAIKVKYNTTRVGPFTKTVTVISNAPDSPTTLTIKGTVEKAQEEVGKEPVKEKTILENTQN